MFFSGATISFLFHTCSRYIVAPRGSRDQTLRVAAGIHPTSPRLCPPVIAIVIVIVIVIVIAIVIVIVRLS